MSSTHTAPKHIRAVRKIGTGEIFPYSIELLKDPRFQLYEGPAPTKSARKVLIDGVYHEVDEFGATTGVTTPFKGDDGEAKPVRTTLENQIDFDPPANPEKVAAVVSAPSSLEVVEVKKPKSTRVSTPEPTPAPAPATTGFGFQASLDDVFNDV